MTNMTTMRENGWLWGLRLVQLLVDLIALAAVGTNASGWHSIGCNPPPNLAFAIAVAALSLPFVLYLISATGGKRQWAKMLPWNGWCQLSFDVLFVLFWLIAVATEHYNCDSVCSACSAGGAQVDVGGGFYVTFGNSHCNCMFEGDFVLLSRRASSSKNVAVSVTKIAVKIGVGVVMLLLFIATMALDAYYIHKHRTSYTKLPASNNAMPAQVPLMKTPQHHTAEMEPATFEQTTAYGYHAADGYHSQAHQEQSQHGHTGQHMSTAQYGFPQPPPHSYGNSGARLYQGV